MRPDRYADYGEGAWLTAIGSISPAGAERARPGTWKPRRPSPITSSIARRAKSRSPPLTAKRISSNTSLSAGDGSRREHAWAVSSDLDRAPDNVRPSVARPRDPARRLYNWRIE